MNLTQKESMTKSQLLERSRELGQQIVQLINEYRNSAGEVVEHDEAYFQDYFAGMIAWMCACEGEMRIEYNKADSFIDGDVSLTSEVRYLFNDVHIHDFKNTTELTSLKEGRIDKTYKIVMDPITCLYYIMGTDLSGAKVFDGAEINETVI